jgi:hypothetical protein
VADDGVTSAAGPATNAPVIPGSEFLRRAVLLRAVSLLGAALLLPGCATEPRFDGPIAARNQHPAQLLVGRLRPRSAAAAPAGAATVEWQTAYSSLFLSGSAGTNSFEMDGEYLRTALTTRLGLGAGLDLELELPIGHASGGFLDDFVVEWHDLFGFPNQGRDLAPTDDFAVSGERDGATVFAVEPHGARLLDIPLALAWAPWAIGEERPFGLLLRGGVELPTGDADAGYGSGEVEWMLGAVAEWRTGPLALNLHAEHTFAASPPRARAAGFDFEDVSSLGIGAEFAVDDNLSLLAQVEMDRSTLRGLDLQRTSADQWLLWTAARFRLGERLRVEVGIGEDLSQYIAPDFSAWLSFAIDFGG